MRALYREKLPEEEQCELQGDALHHLVHVVRIQEGEEILLLDGKGNKVYGKVGAVGKKGFRFISKRRETDSQVLNYDLALIIPKKEALELCLRQATELGFEKIYLIRGDYSQIKVPDPERMEKLLISALEQSNSAFLPQLQETDLRSIEWDDYQSVLWLDSQSSTSEKKIAAKSDKMILLVGPEAGFSQDERTYLLGIKNLERVHLPTPILRTPTALATGTGLLLQRLLDKKRYETLGSERDK
jgi:16S rRNA (uracil1498-N3)-methyltransferase